jgi:hypothetical protein
MARKKKVNGADKGRQIIETAELLALCKVADQCQSRQSEASGALGAAIKSAVEKHNLNPISFRMIQRLRRTGMRDAYQLKIILEDFDAMRDQVELDAMAAATLPLEGGNSQPANPPV